MSSPRWPVVVFDLDGTLVDSINVIVASYQHAFAVVEGRQVTRDEAVLWIGQTLRETFLRESPGHATELENTYLTFCAEKMPEMLTNFPGITPLLLELHDAGIVTGIATSKRRKSATRSMQIAQLPVTVDLTVGMEDTDQHKPHPAPVLLAVERLGATPDQAAYVGDAVFDLQAAHGGGVDGIGVTWGAGSPGDLRAQPSVAVVDAVSELRSLLLG